MTDSQVVGLVAKSTVDVASYSIVLATIVKLLPPLAALVSIVWIGFQFYHSEPVKEWRRKRHESREKEK